MDNEYEVNISVLSYVYKFLSKNETVKCCVLMHVSFVWVIKVDISCMHCWLSLWCGSRYSSGVRVSMMCVCVSRKRGWLWHVWRHRQPLATSHWRHRYFASIWLPLHQVRHSSSLHQLFAGSTIRTLLRRFACALWWIFAVGKSRTGFFYFWFDTDYRVLGIVSCLHFQKFSCYRWTFAGTGITCNEHKPVEWKLR